MAYQFQPPSFVKPNDYGNIPRSIDQLFEQYIQGNAQQSQQARLDAQDARLTSQDKRQQGIDFLERGFDPADAPQLAAQVAGEAPRSAMTPRGAGSPDEFAFEQESPVLAAFKDYMSKKKSGAEMKSRTEQAGLAKIESETAENQAQAAALGRDQIYVDPASGKQITIPMGAKLLPPGTGQAGKMLPPATVLSLNEGKAVARMLPEVETALQQSEGIMGPLRGRVGSANPYDTRAQTVDARFRTASQAFGRFMEGGVLRKEDEEKYRKMFPQLSDTPDVGKNKLSIVRRMLAQKYEDDRQTLGRSGYDISGAEALDIPGSLFDGKAPGAPAGSGPAVGTIKAGYRFKGGNPADKASWEKQ